MKPRRIKSISLIIISIFLLIIVSSCGSNNQEMIIENNSSAPKAESENRCGDGVCDGPESIGNCPADCEAGSTASDQSSGNNTSATDQDGEQADVIAQVYFDVSVQRKDGEGTCGEYPYGMDNIFGGDNSCQGAKYWYTNVLRATAFQKLDVYEQTDGSWLLKYDSLGGGTYQLADASDDGNRICGPVTVNTGPFDFDFVGEVKQGEISFRISTLPLEITDWECDGGNNYQRETTLLLIHWANAISGDYQDLSGSLSSSDLLSSGRYHREYSGSFNPSPENRDSVLVKMDLTCFANAEASSPTACPWE